MLNPFDIEDENDIIDYVEGIDELTITKIKHDNIFISITYYYNSHDFMVYFDNNDNDPVCHEHLNAKEALNIFNEYLIKYNLK